MREMERLQKLGISNLELYGMVKDLQQQVTHKGSTVELQQDPGFDSTHLKRKAAWLPQGPRVMMHMLMRHLKIATRWTISWRRKTVSYTRQ
jgi:hypothetical protein